MYELIDGTPDAMSPEQVRHAEIKLAAALALKNAVEGIEESCHVLPDGYDRYRRRAHYL